MSETKIRPAVGVSLHLIGSEALLLDASRQRLFTLNATAAYVWTCFEDGLPEEYFLDEYAEAFSRTPAESAREVAALAAEWRLLGLFAGGEAPPPAPEAARDRPAPTANPVAARRFCRMLDTRFELRFATETAAQAVWPVVAHLACDPGQTDAVVEVAVDGPGFAIGIDGRFAEDCEALSELAPQVKSAILVEAVNRHGFAAYFHAATLRRDDQLLLLLPGVSGSGKTCLSLALAKAGFAYHSDETALLDPASLALRAVPLALCVKDAAWGLVEPLYPELRALPAHDRIDGKVVKYLPPPVAPGDPALDRAWPARWIVFPTYQAGAKTELQPIGPAEALRRLIQDCNAWRLRLTGESVDRLVSWIEGTECRLLPFSSQDEAVRLIDEFCRPV